MKKILFGIIVGVVGHMIYDGWKTLGNFESSAEDIS